MNNKRIITKTIICPTVALLLCGSSLLAQESALPNHAPQEIDTHRGKKLKNPLIDEPGMSDPHVLVENGVVYLFTGHDIGTGKSAWVMPDWRIYRSTDLQSWEHVGTISPEDNYMGKGNTNCWAGDIVKRNGKYYWYFSNHNKSTGVMVASKPEGPYKDALGNAVNRFASCV